MDLRPNRGGFLRPFGTAWFIVEFLKGNGPEGAKRIDPAEGAPMVDILAEYKTALHHAWAEDMVAMEEERRIARKQPPYTAAESEERIVYWMERLPLKFTKMRYASFTNYFGRLKRLGWVEPTGKVETSTVQEPKPGITNPEGRPRVYYRLTDAGWKATLAEVSNPLRLLYPHFDSEYFREARKRHHYSKRIPD